MNNRENGNDPSIAPKSNAIRLDAGSPPQSMNTGPVPSTPFVVDGTNGNDLINFGYMGDPEGDRIDLGDNAQGTDDDVIMAFDGDDTIAVSAGDDTIFGGEGTDVYTALPSSFRITGSGSADFLGTSVAGGFDVDGDGLSDFLIGAPNAPVPDSPQGRSGISYLVSGIDLLGIDADDGNANGFITSSSISSGPGSYQFLTDNIGDQSGRKVSFIDDLDGDGFAEILIGAPFVDGQSGGTVTGATYLISSRDLTNADLADGIEDGIVDLGNIAGLENSIEIGGGRFDQVFGNSLSSAGDLNGDGSEALLVAANQNIYLTTYSDLLSARDDAGFVNVDDLIGLADSYRIVGRIGQFDGLASAGDVDGDGRDEFLIGIPSQNADGAINAGRTYLIDGDDLAAADAADGTVDGIIQLSELENLSQDPGNPNSGNTYTFVNSANFAQLGFDVASAGDVDGDGLADILISAPDQNNGSSSRAGVVHLISGADLAAADDAGSGNRDGIIDIDDISDQSNSYTFLGGVQSGRVGWSISSAGDFDGDGLDDFIIGANGLSSVGGSSFLISSADLQAADALNSDDGASTDGIIDLGTLAGLSNTYTFMGNSGSTGFDVTAAGDIDGDGLGDFLVSAAFGSQSTQPSSNGVVFVLTGRELQAADAADGSLDGVINESTFSLRSDALRVEVDATGTGTVTSSSGVDQVNSIETYIAGEDADNTVIDEIIINNSNDRAAPTDIAFGQTELNLAVGIFEDAVTGEVLIIGQGQGADITLGELLYPTSGFAPTGRITITDGLESGKVGEIRFDNFERVSFDVMCFCRGTHILTAKGELRIEDLRVGDMILTMDSGYQPIRWIGSTTRPALDGLAPVRIRQGILGNTRDIWVSPQHRMLIRGAEAELLFGEAEVLAPAKGLIDGHGITVEEGGNVEYFHMLFDKHEVIWSENAPSESYHPGQQGWNALDEPARREILDLFPNLVTSSFDSFGGTARRVLKLHEAKCIANMIIEPRQLRERRFVAPALDNVVSHIA